MEPLLTICIPTLDRGELLELGIRNLLGETEPFGDEVEIIVTDNASEGDLEAKVRAASPRIRYYRFPEKVVFPRSILKGPRDLANGKYVWIIGDDDLVLRGAVGRILAFLRAHPDLEFVYLNHGWIPREARNRQILEGECSLPEGYDSFQCRPMDTQILPRIEDLVDLANTNPYAMFSTIFCYIANRRLYRDHAHLVTPLDEWDDAVQTLDNMFPHSKMILTAYAGRPVGYLGEPCFMQGSFPRRGPTYVIKTMIHGTWLLYTYLESTDFDREVLDRLWVALAYMAGRMVARFQDDPEGNLGWEIICGGALPRLIKYAEFWAGVKSETQSFAEIATQAKLLAVLAHRQAAAAGLAEPGIAIWGARGRGERMLKENPWLKAHTRILVDSAAWLHGQLLESCGLVVQPPGRLREEKVDLLVVAARPEFDEAVFAAAEPLLRPGTLLVSLLGCRQAGMVQ